MEVEERAGDDGEEEARPRRFGDDQPGSPEGETEERRSRANEAERMESSSGVKEVIRE